MERIKAAVRTRDGMCCTKCGMTNDAHLKRTGKQLEVHRVRPGSAYSTEPGACVTLCRSCHGPEPRSPRGTYPNGVPIDADVMYQVRFVYRVKKFRGELPPRASFTAFLNALLIPLVDADYRRVMDAMQLATPSTC